MSAANLAAAEKLRKFGFAMNCGEFGSEKYTKSALCVYDVLAEKETPNILIITRQSELYSWYRYLLTSVGADFKMVSGAGNALLYFNENGSGLYLISRETLFGENLLKRRAGKDFKWDLVIIDEELSSSVPKYDEYKKNIIWKSDKLLINAPLPVKKSEDKAALTDLIKSILSDASKAAKAEEMKFDESACVLDENSLVMRYYDKAVYSDDFKREVSIIDYGYEDTVLTYFRRKVDLRTGIPTYSSGGNVFEQYDCDKNEKEKKIYLKPFYSRSDVEDLRTFDKKLDALLNVMEEIFADEKSRTMIYCCNKNSVEYLRKVLVCLYGTNVSVMRGELIISGAIKRKLSNCPDDEMSRITIGTDMLGTFVDGPDTVDHVINYELPSSPAVLERRMTRHGSVGETGRKFILFRDKNGVFDTPLLEKTLLLRIGECFCSGLPARNILFDLKEKGELLNSLVKDLRYLRDYSKQVDNCADVIKRVKCEYILAGTDQITNSKQLHDFAEKKLSKIYRLFGLSDSSQPADIAAAANNLSGLCAADSNGMLTKAQGRTKAADAIDDKSFFNLPFAAEAVEGLARAKADIDELHKGDDFHLRIKQEISSMNDSIQYSVLYGIWKYRAKEQHSSDRTFKDYIKIYNDGM